MKCCLSVIAKSISTADSTCGNADRAAIYPQKKEELEVCKCSLRSVTVNLYLCLERQQRAYMLDFSQMFPVKLKEYTVYIALASDTFLCRER